MSNQILRARIINLHDVEENWNKTDKFVPRAGELIVYDIDSNNTRVRFKFGDGQTDVKNLPFVEEIFTDVISSNIFGSFSDDVVYLDGGNITSYK